jgi:seryl-tRNA synthetase
MIDIKDLIRRPEYYKEALRKKQIKDVSIDEIIKLKEEQNKIKYKIDQLRHELNKLSKPDLSSEEKTKAKELKMEIKKLTDDYQNLSQDLKNKLSLIPNPPLEDVPYGESDEENVEIKRWGKIPDFDFEPLDHVALGEKYDLLDIERAGKISGSRFAYLKNELFWLEFALVRFVLDRLTNKDYISKVIKENNLDLESKTFIPILPPVLVKPEIMWSMGFLDRGREEVYELPKDDLMLIGTAEQSVGSLHKDEILSENRLPLRYLGFSSCFRREAGSYGKDVRGIMRVHQFDKLEMISFTTKENSDKEHRLFLALEEKMMQELIVPYRVLLICTGDLGDSAAKKYDIEAWIPSQKRYRETHSTSNTTDFQARRLNTRVKRKNGKLEFVHIINGTAFAIGRILIAILENYQRRDHIEIPEALQPYLPFDHIPSHLR